MILWIVLNEVIMVEYFIKVKKKKNFKLFSEVFIDISSG